MQKEYGRTDERRCMLKRAWKRKSLDVARAERIFSGTLGWYAA